MHPFYVNMLFACWLKMWIENILLYSIRFNSIYKKEMLIKTQFIISYNKSYDFELKPTIIANVVNEEAIL